MKLKYRSGGRYNIGGMLSNPAVSGAMGGLMKGFRKGGKFPDLNKDGKITMADILKGRKVFRSGGLLQNGETLEGDPKKDASRVVGQYEPTVETTQDAEFTETEGKQEATQEGMIGAINKDFDIKTQSLDDLPQDQKDLIMASEFGKTYMVGEGSFDDKYRAYTAKVNDFLTNNPEQALANINAMMETNDNFRTKLEGKSDQEKLDITRDMMTDGKIGDFHGKILTTTVENPMYLYGGDKGTNITNSGGAEVIYGVGNQAIGENFQGAYRDAMIEAGVDLSDPKAMEKFFNQYIQDNPDALTDRQFGVQDRGFTEQNIERAKAKALPTAQGVEAGMNTGAQAAKTKNELTVKLQKLIQGRGYNRNSPEYKEATAEIEALRDQINSMYAGGKMRLKKNQLMGGANLKRMLDAGATLSKKPRKGSVSVIANDKNIEDMPESTTKRTLLTKTTTDPSGTFSVTNPNILGRLFKKSRTPVVTARL